MQKALAVIAAVAVSLSLSGCSTETNPGWSLGSGPIKVVASTNVWASIANLIGGDAVTASAIIYKPSQDPHSYELTARDRLQIDAADLVIENGGGYDDFMKQAVAADNSPAKVIDAFVIAETDSNANEHVWFDLVNLPKVANAIASEIETLQPNFKSAVEENLKTFNAEIVSLIEGLKQTQRNPQSIFMTEPIAKYLIDLSGFVDQTPKEFSTAIEEERDVPPLALKDSIELLKNPGISILFVNTNTETIQIEALRKSINEKVKVIQVNELLETNENYLEMLTKLISKMVAAWQTY